MEIVMLLTNGFDPDPRVYKEAKTLVDNGNSVVILCWDREEKYKEKPIETYNGIKIQRFFFKGKYGSGYMQLLGYTKFINAAFEYIKNSNCDAVHCHDFDTLYAGYKAKIMKRELKLIFDEHDLFYQYFLNRKDILNKLIGKIVKFVQKRLSKKADYHIVVSENMSKLYKESNILIINNAPLADTFKEITKTNRNTISIGFIGSVRFLEELRILIDVSNKFSNISVFIAGKGIALNDLTSYAQNKGVKNVVIKGQFHLSELESLYKEVDLMYCVFSISDRSISMPNKFFECILTQTPIIADKSSEFGKIVASKKLGFTLNSENLESELYNILSSIEKNKSIINEIKSNMSKLGNEYTWNQNVNKLLNIYKN